MLNSLEIKDMWKINFIQELQQSIVLYRIENRRKKKLAFNLIFFFNKQADIFKCIVVWLLVLWSYIAETKNNKQAYIFNT